MQEAYIIKKPMFQEYETIAWVNKNVVYACPYNGPKKKEFEFRKQISHFFWHIIHCSMYSKKKKSHTINDLPYVPFPSELGRKKLPMVFGGFGEYEGKSWEVAKTKKNFWRALDWLQEHVLDYTGYIFGNYGRSRSYRIKLEILNKMYPYQVRSAQYIFSRARFCDPLLTRMDNLGHTIKEMLDSKGLTDLPFPNHDLSAIDRNTGRQTRKLYNTVLKRQAPNTITIIPILQELAKLSHYHKASVRSKVILMYANLMSVLHSGFSVVDREKMIISYYPRYLVGNIGGRLFEIGGGFQNMPKGLKQQSHCVGYNVDMRSSQLNIIKIELKKNNINCPLLDQVSSVGDFAEMFGMSRDETKTCFYGTVFSMGRSMQRSSWAQSSPIKVLKENKRKEHHKRALSVIMRTEDEPISMKNIVTAREALLDRSIEKVRAHWEEVTMPIVQALETLCDCYVSKARKSGDGYIATNAVGMRYWWQDKEPAFQIRKKILSHMITGIEAKFLFDAILENDVKQVYSFEHDGALLSKPDLISTGIEFAQKPFADGVSQMFQNL